MPVNFVKSKNKVTSLAESKINTEGIYFPTDDTCIIMNGKEYAVGVKTIELTQEQFDALEEAGELQEGVRYEIYED